MGKGRRDKVLCKYGFRKLVVYHRVFRTKGSRLLHDAPGQDWSSGKRALVSRNNKATESSLGTADKVQDDMVASNDDHNPAFENTGSHRNAELPSGEVWGPAWNRKSTYDRGQTILFRNSKLYVPIRCWNVHTL